MKVSSFKSSRNSLVPWNMLNITKAVLTVLLIILPLIELLWLIWFKTTDNFVSSAVFVANCVRILTYSSILFLQIKCQVDDETHFCCDI